jgi:hypothetical protein
MVCHNIAVDSGWRLCAERSAQASTRKLADAHLQGDAVLDPAFVYGEYVHYHVFVASGVFGVTSP